MSPSAINLSHPDFMRLSSKAREEILALFRKEESITPTTTLQIEPTDEENPPELTQVQAKRLVDGVAEQTKAVLRYIAEQPVEGFSLRGVHQAAGMDTMTGLRGSWGGITKRSRRVLEDPDAELIWWENSPTNEDDTNEDDTNDDDMVGRVSEATHRSLRKVFGMR